MKKSTRILVCGAVVAYAMFSYGAISAKMSGQKFAAATSECRQTLQTGLSRRVATVCTPLELIDLRDQGGVLTPSQHEVIQAADDWFASDYWRKSAFGVLFLSALLKIWEFLAGRWPHLADRLTRLLQGRRW